MIPRFVPRLLIAVLVLLLAAPTFAPSPAQAANAKGGAKKSNKEKAEESGGGPIGYNDSKVQMAPFMVPYRASDGIRYEPITVRMTLGPDPHERPACFYIPIVHDRFVQYLYKANLTGADLAGDRRKVLAEKLLQVAVATTGKGFYSGAEIVDVEPKSADPEAPPPMNNKSMTLSAQCK